MGVVGIFVSKHREDKIVDKKVEKKPEKELTEKQKKSIVKGIKEDGESSKSIIKLLTDKVEIKIKKFKGLEESAASDLESLKKALKATEPNADAEKIVADAEAKIKLLSDQEIHGYLTPLRYREIQMIKLGIAEAQLETRKANMELDVQILAAVLEQRCMTVYYSLKKLDEKSRYFGTPEDVAALPDDVVEELFTLYIKHIGLTPEERKNLPGAHSS